MQNSLSREKSATYQALMNMGYPQSVALDAAQRYISVEECIEKMSTFNPTPPPTQSGFRSEASQIRIAQQLSLNNCYNIPAQDRIRSKDMPVGLQNLGASCYFNSMLQIYFHNPEFVRSILQPEIKAIPNISKKKQVIHP